MLLNKYQILSRCQDGMIEGFKPAAINASSLDIHLGRYILVERMPESHKNTGLNVVVSLRQKDPLCMERIDLDAVPGNSFILRPGQFILAETEEKFHMPQNVSAEYKLKSSMARIGLEHLNAGWIDAGFNNSVLTLEFRNLNTFHEIELVKGDRVGQIIFYQHEPLKYDDSYAATGRYNGLSTVSGPLQK